MEGHAHGSGAIDELGCLFRGDSPLSGQGPDHDTVDPNLLSGLDVPERRFLLEFAVKKVASSRPHDDMQFDIELSAAYRDHPLAGCQTAF